MTRRYFSFLILGFLISPYLILLLFLLKNGSNGSLPPEFKDVLSFTLLQALLSSTFALVLGVIASFGLLAIRGNSRAKNNFLSLFVLLPSAVPVLFVIISALNLFPGLNGLAGVVILHSLINLGLVAITVESLIRESVGTYVELAWVEGASRTALLTKVVFPILKKDLFLIWLAIFSFCFSSFAIPLIIGGSRAVTLEVLIYKLLRIDENWASAYLIAVFQASLIFVLSFLISSQKSFGKSKEVNLGFLSWAPLSSFAILPSLVLLVGLIAGAAAGFSQLFDEIPLKTIAELSLNSTIISVLTGLFSLGFLFSLGILQPATSIRKFIRGFFAPSSILTGFAILLVWRDVGFASLIKISIGLTLIFVPALYRLGWESKFDNLKGQLQTAQVLGATSWQTFTEITWPQMAPVAARLIALASFWAWGEFALTKIISERTLSLSLLVQSLISSYRLNSATALLWLMLLASAITSLCVWGLVNVSSRKSFN